MYPVLLRIGSFEVTSFGVMVAVAAVVGLWLFAGSCIRVFGLSVAHLVSLAAIVVGIGVTTLSKPIRRTAYSDRNLF